jgi:hypothetical protein
MPFLVKTFKNGQSCLPETLTGNWTNAGHTCRFTNETRCSSGIFVTENRFPSWVCFLETSKRNPNTINDSINLFLQYYQPSCPCLRQQLVSFHFWRIYVTVSSALLFNVRFKHTLKVLVVNEVRWVLQEVNWNRSIKTGLWEMKMWGYQLNIIDPGLGPMVDFCDVCDEP